MKNFIVRLPAVLNASQQSRSTIYLRIQQGLFPKPIHLGPRSVGWPQTELDAMNAALIAGKSEDEIRALVTRLALARRGKLEEVLS